MWKVRETKKVGVKTFYEVYKTTPSGRTKTRGHWDYHNDAQALADKLNEEEGYDERIC
jgi:hypothetical protein